MTDATAPNLVEPVAQIVAAYVSHNVLERSELTTLIADVHAALMRLGSRPQPDDGEKQRPAVPVSKSIASEYLICLEDGKKFKSLKRHLRAKYNMSPDDYRAKWGLKSDYPMVAPNYAQARSDLARKMGLGTRKGA